MKKIPTLFQREFGKGHVLCRDEVTPGCEWVIEGEGTSTVKYDGTACMIKDGKFYKRYDVKKGRTPPDTFIPAQEPDEKTGHWPGWVPVGPEDTWFIVAAKNTGDLEDGTYEAIGPHFGGNDVRGVHDSNPEHIVNDFLVKHGNMPLMDCPTVRTFETLREYLIPLDIEGIVFHHPDGRMAKIKKRDFGLKRRIS